MNPRLGQFFMTQRGQFWISFDNGVPITAMLMEIRIQTHCLGKWDQAYLASLMSFGPKLTGLAAGPAFTPRDGHGPLPRRPCGRFNLAILREQ